MSARASRAVILVAHGTVDRVDDLGPFLMRIRRGHAAPPELLAEVTRRYLAIGGQSPLNGINRRLAEKLEGHLSVPVRLANRLAAPEPQEVLAELASLGVRSAAVVPLAQFSAAIYADSVRSSAAQMVGAPELHFADNWGSRDDLVAAQAARVSRALTQIPERDRPRTTVIFSAHSLPSSVIQAGDHYADEVSASVRKLAEALSIGSGGLADRWVLAYQSQGLSRGPGGRPIEWLGPDLPSVIAECKELGMTHVVFAPVGFLADHVEVLYDLDIEAKAWVDAAGMRYSRAESLNEGEDFVEVLATMSRELLRT